MASKAIRAALVRRANRKPHFGQRHSIGEEGWCKRAGASSEVDEVRPILLAERLNIRGTELRASIN